MTSHLIPGEGGGREGGDAELASSKCKSMDSLTKIGARNLAATPPVKDSEAAPLNRSMSSWQAGRRSAIADDPKKLNAAVDGMARFLAQALLVKDLTLVDADEGTNVV